jgi:cytochrome c oxidase subunit 4
MSDTTELTEIEGASEHGGSLVVAEQRVVERHGEQPHPEPRQYVLIAVVLVIVTAVEVAVSYISSDTIGPNFIIVMLFSMALIKFTLVVSWYMHLKTDRRILRRFFLVGLIGAPLLYLIIALALQALTKHYNEPSGLAP